MFTRRSLIVGAGAPWLLPSVGAAWLRELAADPGGRAEDEAFWGGVARAFAVDRSLVNLNNGGVSPSPSAVQDAYRRHLDVANSAPAYTMWRLQDSQRETVRKGLARLFGADPEEVALTRNTSEGLWTCQYGLPLEQGDEVLTSSQDYPRMLEAFRQLERRRGVRLVQIELPVPVADPSEVVRRFQTATTERTRMILCSHVVNLTGDVLPVRELCAWGRERGIPVLVDGAHAFAQLAFQQADLDCDYYATSLHKWLNAPFGTGMLYVRRERIGGLWPLTAAAESLDGDIRKFEQIGTYPVPLVLSIADALAFHEALGTERKLARMRHLRRLWVEPLAQHERVRFHTHLGGQGGGFDAAACAGTGTSIANFTIDGIEPEALTRHLWLNERIYTIAIGHPAVRGVRVTPGVYTLPSELERFVAAVERVLRFGLPA